MGEGPRLRCICLRLRFSIFSWPFTALISCVTRFITISFFGSTDAPATTSLLESGGTFCVRLRLGSARARSKEPQP